jgi:protocatechuate 3,4-dioxygenase, alpha subunit
MSLRATASQTIGPFFKVAFASLYWAELGSPDASPRIVVEGRLFDGDGPADQAVIELWQADQEGRYPHAEDPRGAEVDGGFRGFGRLQTDAEGRFRFTTVKPGSVPGPGGVEQAPHITVQVFMPGLLKSVSTRMYFPDPPASDPVLALVPPARRGTLIATPASGGQLTWDIHLQGPLETVFLEF